MSDLRERLIEALPHLGLGRTDWEGGQTVDALLPIIEAEIQKVREVNAQIDDGLREWWETKYQRVEGDLTEANKLLGQTIEVLEGSPLYETSDHDCCDECDWWLDKIQPLLDNLKARGKDGSSN